MLTGVGGACCMYYPGLPFRSRLILLAAGLLLKTVRSWGSFWGITLIEESCLTRGTLPLRTQPHPTTDTRYKALASLSQSGIVLKGHPASRTHCEFGWGLHWHWGQNKKYFQVNWGSLLLTDLRQRTVAFQWKKTDPVPNKKTFSMGEMEGILLSK